MAALLVLVVGAAFAQTDLPGSGWWSGEQVQNVGGSTASVMITAFDSGSTATFTEDVSLGAGAAYTFTPFNAFAGMPDGFKGSAVVSADQPIKAIVNVTNQPVQDLGVAGGRAVAQYQGTGGETTVNTLYFPLAKGNYFGKTTSFYVQNAGDTAASGVVATFTMRNSDVHTYNLPTIEPNRMVVFSVHNAGTFNANNANNDAKVGGLVVSGGAALAGVVMEHATTGEPAITLNGTRGLVEADFASTAYAPVIKNNWFGRFTGLQVQNVSGAPINVTVSYEGTGGACDGNSYTDSANNVASNTSVTFVHLTGQTTLPANCLASATVTGTGNFVAIVNEEQVSGGAPAGITYYALNDTSNTVSAPLFKDVFFGATSGLQIQNVGNAATTNWSATFVCTTQGGASFTAVSDDAKTGQIAPGSAYLFFTPSGDNLFTAGNPFSASQANCAVTIQADQPIVAVVNEMAYTTAPTGALDDNNYEGFNLN
jgi:hypothetical protein